MSTDMDSVFANPLTSLVYGLLMLVLPPVAFVMGMAGVLKYWAVHSPLEYIVPDWRWHFLLAGGVVLAVFSRRLPKIYRKLTRVGR